MIAETNGLQIKGEILPGYEEIFTTGGSSIHGKN